jgi:hypothetical protein
MNSPSTRRQFVKRAAIAAPVIGVIAATPSAASAAGSTTGTGFRVLAQATPTPVEQAVGEATAPNWRFTVSKFADPYEGEISRPAKPPADSRFVGAEVIVTNDSDQPLEFSAADVRLRDAGGVEYTAGSVVGEEPKLVSQNLPEGERTRGWVWFSVPLDSPLSDLRFSGPVPTFRVAIPNS